MGDPIRPTPITTFTGVQELDGLEQTGLEQKKGMPRPLGTEPPPVTQQFDESPVPQNDPPRPVPKTVEERYQSIVDTLNSSVDGPDISILMQRIQELQQELNKEQEKTQVGEIKTNQTKIENNAKEQLKKIEENRIEMNKQAVWETVKKVFAVIAAIFAVVAAAVVMVATGGSAAPLIIAGIAAAITVAQTFGLTDKLFDALGVDQNARAWIMIGISIALLAAGGISGVMSAGSGVAMVAATTAKALKIATALITGALKATEGGAQIARSVIQLDVNKTEDDRKTLQRDQLRMKKMQDDLVEDLRKLMQEMEEGVKIVTSTVQTQHQTVLKSIQNMS